MLWLLTVILCSKIKSQNEIKNVIELSLYTKIRVVTNVKFQKTQGFTVINHPVLRTDLNKTERDLVFGEGN
ncbi:hypothetical protein BW723_10370 [Polaribacter reichenbachii]|uniref:Uncharacterized protein n=1 Tax=Polaribacter reichenbachii TaxID=996801 RepID=A0A1B8TNK5_9FLAO|nr:hypothetical protein BW723_10370 [Polaribacter reichenbachii]AUC17312.1 hypothetical protein BTO17_00815 [Polaribacter reichenbachii]OBY61240.1 hypothetical protein LPB301_17385 [Polaribacter reichenbachii]